MKLSKAKSIIKQSSSLYVFHECERIQVITWISNGICCYPIRNVNISGEELCRIIGLDEKQFMIKEITKDELMAKIILSFPLMAENCNTERVSQLDGFTLLYNHDEERSVIINSELIAPCTGKGEMEYQTSDENLAGSGARLVGIYSGTMLEGIVLAKPWESALWNVMQKIGLIYQRERAYEQYGARREDSDLSEDGEADA